MKYFRHLPLLGWFAIALVFVAVITGSLVAGRDSGVDPVRINRIDLHAREMLFRTDLDLVAISRLPESEWDTGLLEAAADLRLFAESYTDAAAAPLLDIATAIEDTIDAEPGDRRPALNQAISLIVTTRSGA